MSEYVEDMRALRAINKADRAGARERQKDELRRMRDEGTLTIAQFTPYHWRVRRVDGQGETFDVWPGTPTFRRVGARRGEYGWAELMQALGMEGVGAP